MCDQELWKSYTPRFDTISLDGVGEPTIHHSDALRRAAETGCKVIEIVPLEAVRWSLELAIKEAGGVDVAVLEVAALAISKLENRSWNHRDPGFVSPAHEHEG